MNMKLPKEVADRIAREFRAAMNKAARDGLVHQQTFCNPEKYTIHFAVEVRRNSEDCADDWGPKWRRRDPDRRSGGE